MLLGQGPYGFWKVLEGYGNQKCLFPGPGKFWKREMIFKIAMEKFWIFVCKSSNDILKCI